MNRRPKREDLVQLLRVLVDRFDENELRTLCFHLRVDYDSLRGEGKSDNARELILFLERRDRISEFLKIGKQMRPDIPWDSILSTPEETPTEPDETDRASAPGPISWLRRLPPAAQASLVGMIVVAIIGLCGTLGVPVIENLLSASDKPVTTIEPAASPSLAPSPTNTSFASATPAQESPTTAPATPTSTLTPTATASPVPPTDTPTPTPTQPPSAFAACPPAVRAEELLVVGLYSAPFNSINAEGEPLVGKYFDQFEAFCPGVRVEYLPLTATDLGPARLTNAFDLICCFSSASTADSHVERGIMFPLDDYLTESYSPLEVYTYGGDTYGLFFDLDGQFGILSANTLTPRPVVTVYSIEYLSYLSTR